MERMPTPARNRERACKPCHWRASQVILFLPAALLCVLGLNVGRNAFARHVVRAQDAPEGDREAVVLLLYSSLYPFAGQVEAFLEVRRLPDHELETVRSLGAHRWASQAVDAYRSIDWKEPNRITLRSADGTQTRSVHLDRMERGGRFPSRESRSATEDS